MMAIKEVLKFKSPESMVAAAVVDPDVMGPTILYRLILDHVSPSAFIWPTAQALSLT